MTTRTGVAGRARTGRRALAARFAGAVVLASTATAATDGGAPGASTDVELLPFRRALVLPAASPGTADWVEIWDDSILAARAAADFADVRFVDDHGLAVPFTRREPALHDAWDTPVAQARFGGAGQDVVVADLGASASRLVVLRVRGETHGRAFVVEASHDSTTWRPIGWPRVEARDDGGFETFVLDTVAERWLRVQVAHGRPPGAARAPRPDAAPLPWDGLDLEFRVRQARRTPREPVPFRVVRTRFEGRRFIAELEADGAPLALCRLVLVPRAPLAHHPVRVEGRLAAGGYRDLVHAGIETVPHADGTSRRHAIEWEPFRTDALRIIVDGADAPHAPVTIDSLLRAPLRFGLPRASAARWLAFGDAHVQAAHVAIDAGRLDVEVARAALGPVQANPLYRAPGFGLAWLQRHPAAVAVVLALVLACVAGLVLRAPRRA